MTLALALFAFVLITEVISWVGKSVLQELACTMYLNVVQRSKMSRQRALKGEILSTKAELLKTSAQDEFAKWAKLRRKVDKGLADLEELNKALVSVKASFGVTFSTVLWLVTSGVQVALGWWYSWQAVFFVPRSLLGPLTWWLAFPFAPSGSVSCMVWQFACKRVIKSCELIVRDFILKPKLHAVPVPGGTAGETDDESTFANTEHHKAR